MERAKNRVSKLTDRLLIEGSSLLIKALYRCQARSINKLITLVTDSEVHSAVDLYIHPCPTWYVLEPKAPRTYLQKLVSLLGITPKPLLVPTVPLSELLTCLSLKLSEAANKSNDFNNPNDLTGVLQPLVFNLNVAPLSRLVQVASSLEVLPPHRQYILAHKLFQSMARVQAVMSGTQSPYISIKEGFLCLGVDHNKDYPISSWQSEFIPIDRVPLYRF